MGNNPNLVTLEQFNEFAKEVVILQKMVRNNGIK